MLKYLFIFFVFYPGLVFSKIEIKTVEVDGRGTTETLAIESALVEAVSQINGTEIAAKLKQTFRSFFKWKDRNRGIFQSRGRKKNRWSHKKL